MMKITVNDQIIVNNFPDGNDPASVFSDLTEEEKNNLENDQSLFKIALDTYTLPSVILKVLKSMKLHEVVEISTSRIDKLHTNFAGELFD